MPPARKPARRRSPCCDTFLSPQVCAGAGTRAELDEHPQRVPGGPLLDHHVVLDAGDGEARDGDLLARRGDPGDLAGLDAAAGPPGGDLVALGDLVVDRDRSAGKSCEVLLDVRPHSGGPADGHRLRPSRTVRVGRHKRPRDVPVAPPWLLEHLRRTISFASAIGAPLVRLRQRSTIAARAPAATPATASAIAGPTTLRLRLLNTVARL